MLADKPVLYLLGAEGTPSGLRVYRLCWHRAGHAGEDGMLVN